MSFGQISRWIRLLPHRIGGLLPTSCLLCGAAAAENLCADCRADLPFNANCCARCALPLPQPSAACGQCLKRPPRFRIHAPLRYVAPIDSLVTRFKFSADLAAGDTLARILVTHLQSQPQAAPDLILPVPLHPRRLRARGYNQALILARVLAQETGVPVGFKALSRVRDTAMQAGLGALARRRNVRAAFVADSSVAGQRIGLVDDVVTTAATVRACADCLLRAGAASVDVFAVARAPAPR